MVFFGRCCLALWLMHLLLLILFVGAAGTQGIPPFAGQSPSLASPPPQLLTPSNPLGAPGSGYSSVGSDYIPLSSAMFSGMLPRIPNLEVGFLYNFGNNVRSGRLYADYLVPLSLSSDSVLFGEAHYETQDFWKRPSGGSQYRQDLSLGGGFRRVLGDSSFLGINAFYDTSKLYGKWYSSGGAGLEMVTLTPGDGVIDLNFNWYGNLLNRSELINAFRNKSGSWDIEVGVSQPLFDQALDLRLNGTAYQFNTGSAVYGWRTGAELTTRDGFFTLKYEYGRDKVNGSYNTVGAYVNVGFQLENIASWQSPFTAPQPVFGSPRNLKRLLTQKVRRNWHQPAALVVSGGGELIRTTIDPYPLEYDAPIDIWHAPGYNIPFREGSMPYTYLDPNKIIIVEFDYAFGADPGSTIWWIVVQSTPFGAWNGNAHLTTTSDISGHVVAQLIYDDWPEMYQEAFTSTHLNPGQLMIECRPTNWLPSLNPTVTNVVIRFNQ